MFTPIVRLCPLPFCLICPKIKPYRATDGESTTRRPYNPWIPNSTEDGFPSIPFVSSFASPPIRHIPPRLVQRYHLTPPCLATVKPLLCSSASSPKSITLCPLRRKECPRAVGPRTAPEQIVRLTRMRAWPCQPWYGARTRSREPAAGISTPHGSRRSKPCE